jgi:hypothetical protein
MTMAAGLAFQVVVTMDDDPKSKGLITVFDQPSARAIEETAKTGRAAIESADRLGKYVAGVLGDAPHNAVGIVGDWLYHKRLRNWDALKRETDEILKARGVDPPEEPSPSVAIPLIDAAVDEDRDELRTIWATLLAAALDRSRKRFVRRSVIDTVKQMEPLDALVLQEVGGFSGSWTPNGRDYLKNKLSSQEYEILVSFDNLEKLQCLYFSETPHINPTLNSLGRLILQALQ